MNATVRRVVLAITLAALALSAWAQEGDDAAPDSEPQESTEALADEAEEAGLPEPSEQAPSLEQAYQKEFAFLQSQKRDLESRLEAFRESSREEQQQMQSEIEAIEREVVELDNRADRLEDQVAEAERSVDSAEDNVNLLTSTFLQAEATIDDWQGPAIEGDETPTEDDVAGLFEAVGAELEQRGGIRRSEGEFFLADGTRVEGEIIHVGQIASYGISDRGAGALAPAGEGELKIWNEASAEAAQSLAAGQVVNPLPIFIYESLSSEVEQKDETGVFEKVQQGGVIGWVIFFLGLLALLLVILRAVFLWRASASTGRIIDSIGGHVRRGDRDAALKVLEKKPGATSRVVASAVRNLDRDREYLEDIVSESILHESGHLNRFGAFILVIAAVSPLLGLLGTVTGMISTFDVITEFGTGDPKLLSGGISIALVTTEMGLMVAIPTLLLGNLLSGWAERIKDDMEKAALRVTNQYTEARSEADTTRAGQEGA